MSRRYRKDLMACTGGLLFEDADPASFTATIDYPSAVRLIVRTSLRRLHSVVEIAGDLALASTASYTVSAGAAPAPSAVFVKVPSLPVDPAGFSALSYNAANIKSACVYTLRVHGTVETSNT